MRAYLSYARGSFLSGLAYRSGFIFAILNNLVYMTIAYFLWRSIFGDNQTLRGLTFEQTFLYVTIASSLMVLLKTWTDWEISWNITSGSIIMSLVKPLKYQWMMMAQSLGFCLMNFLSIVVPSLIFLVFVFKIPINTGVGLLFFPVAIIFSFILNTTIDYIIGLTSFYTESIWGISSTKDIIILFLSGSLIPLQFFPEAAQKVLKLLPFQAMYHLPLMMLVEPEQTASSYLVSLSVQLFWVAVILILARLFYNRAVKVLRVAGG
ncbi:MAG: ABC-2 family transporter protein [Anaerolineales bacterium]|nr:ABC-2 family transporter protein [Anaerolineales bacterium]